MTCRRLVAGLALATGLLSASPWAQPVFRGTEILVTDHGDENLSAFVPIEVKDIEKPMAQRGLSHAMIRRRDGTR
jgi:hypothetical protein